MICNVQKDFVYVQMPEVFFDFQKLSSLISIYISKGIKIDLKKSNGSVILEIYDKDADSIVKKIFSKYHKIPINFKHSEIVAVFPSIIGGIIFATLSPDENGRPNTLAESLIACLALIVANVTM